MGLSTLACWNCCFESSRRHRCIDVVSIVCCQVEVSATYRSLVKRGPTECVMWCVCVFLCHWMRSGERITFYAYNEYIKEARKRQRHGRWRNLKLIVNSLITRGQKIGTESYLYFQTCKSYERPKNTRKYLFHCWQSVWTSRILFSWRKGNNIRGIYEDIQMDRQTGGW